MKIRNSPVNQIRNRIQKYLHISSYGIQLANADKTRNPVLRLPALIPKGIAFFRIHFTNTIKPCNPVFSLPTLIPNQ